MVVMINYARCFGFTDPFPVHDEEFGYEAWAMLTDTSDSVLSETQNEKIMIKDFDGGLYATAEATVITIHEMSGIMIELLELRF